MSPQNVSEGFTFIEASVFESSYNYHHDYHRDANIFYLCAGRLQIKKKTK